MTNQCSLMADYNLRIKLLIMYISWYEILLKYYIPLHEYLMFPLLAAMFELSYADLTVNLEPKKEEWLKFLDYIVQCEV